MAAMRAGFFAACSEKSRPQGKPVAPRTESHLGSSDDSGELNKISKARFGLPAQHFPVDLDCYASDTHSNNIDVDLRLLPWSYTVK